MATVVEGTSDDETLPPDRGVIRPGDAGGLAREKGESLGRYVVLSKLGEGGMGVVYGAYDPELDRKVAIKVLRQEFAGDASMGRARLQREAQALARLSHPNIVGIYDVGVVDDGVWIAMEFVSGLTLRDWLEARERTWRETLEVMHAAGRGLSAAHGADLVHRDFKPDNVMVSEEGRVLVMDFGLARQSNSELALEDATVPEPMLAPTTDSLSSELTRTGALSGTPRYMSPEQFLGQPAEATSDQFSFCVAFWDALFGEPPFAGQTPAALCFNVSQGHLRSPKRGRKVPTWLRRVVERGLKVDPATRWPSMAALLEGLAHSRRRRTRRIGLIVLAGIGGLIAAALGLQALDEERTRSACVASGDEIDEVWNAEVRRGLEASIRASDRAFAGTTLARLLPALDTYAADWSAVRTQACLATRVDSSLSEAQLEGRERCLETTLAGFAFLVESLEGEDAVEDAIGHALEAVSTLDAPSRCEEDERLERQPVPPEGASETVQTVRTMLARASSLVVLGRAPEAPEIAEQALELATELGWQPLIGEAEFALGQLLSKVGEYARAEELERSAYWRAASAGDETLALRVALRLSSLISDDPSRLDEAEDWYRHAEVYRSRVPDPNRLFEAAGIEALASVRREQGKTQEALDLYTHALAIQTGQLGEGHPHVAVVTNNLALVYDEFGDQKQAGVLYTEAIRILENYYGGDHPQVALALSNLGTTQAQTGKRLEAKALLERALKIQEGAYGPEHLETAKILINLGQLYLSLGDAEAAEVAYERAIPVFKRVLGSSHPVYAMTLTNLGGLRLDEDRLDDAQVLYDEALGLMEASLPEGDQAIAYALDGLARIARRRGDNETAKAHLRRCVEIYAGTWGPEHPVLGWYLGELAGIALDEGEFEEAKTLLERARELTPAEEEVDGAHLDFLWAQVLARGEAPGPEARALAEAALKIHEDSPDSSERIIAEMKKFLAR